MPLPGTIAASPSSAGYVPSIGAWTAGAFAVLIALGGEGPEVALAMAVVILLANGIFQQLVQPAAYGAALGLHPLAELSASRSTTDREEAPASSPASPGEVGEPGIA